MENVTRNEIVSVLKKYYSDAMVTAVITGLKKPSLDMAKKLYEEHGLPYELWDRETIRRICLIKPKREQK